MPFQQDAIPKGAFNAMLASASAVAMRFWPIAH